MPSLVITGIDDNLWRVHHPVIYPCGSGPLGLAIPLWVGATSTGFGFDHGWGRNGVFCIAVGNATILLAYWLILC